jgi:hypothetical protein
MTLPDRTYDPIRFSRGTRGFAALVTAFNGLVVFALAVFVAPTLDLDPLVATWAVLVGVVAGIAHVVAAIGLVRGRRWSAQLVGYLGAGGVAIAAAAVLAGLIGLDVFGAQPATLAGFSAWMMAWWFVAIRFAVKPFRFERPWSSVGVAGLRVPTPRLVAPSAAVADRPRARVILRPISTPTA